MHFTHSMFGHYFFLIIFLFLFFVFLFVYTNANYFFLDFVTFYGWTYSGELHVKFVLLLIFRSRLGVISSLFWSQYSTCYPIWKSPDDMWQMLCHLSLNGWTLHSIHYVKGWKNGAGKELTIMQSYFLQAAFSWKSIQGKYISSISMQVEMHL